jgi:hypothetical protein
MASSSTSTLLKKKFQKGNSSDNDSSLDGAKGGGSVTSRTNKHNRDIIQNLKS